MNNFATIKHINSFKKVTYYSICINTNREESLFEQFIKSNEKANKEKLNHILSWLEKMGNEYAAHSFYFRNEALFTDVSALPPKNPNWEPSFIHWNKYAKNSETNNLRLYTFRANKHVVFLFNGGLKTTQKAQECPNVKSHFKLANRLTHSIQRAFEEGRIKWNKQYSDIQFEQTLKLHTTL